MGNQKKSQNISSPLMKSFFWAGFLSSPAWHSLWNCLAFLPTQEGQKITLNSRKTKQELLQAVFPSQAPQTGSAALDYTAKHKQFTLDWRPNGRDLKKKKTSSCISKGFWFLLLIRDSVSQGALSYNNIQQLDFQSFGTTLYIWLCINSVCWATLASRIKITQAVFYLFPNHSLRLHCKCWYVVPVSTGTSFALCKQRLF